MGSGDLQYYRLWSGWSDGGSAYPRYKSICRHWRDLSNEAAPEFLSVRRRKDVAEVTMRGSAVAWSDPPQKRIELLLAEPAMSTNVSGLPEQIKPLSAWRGGKSLKRFRKTTASPNPRRSV